MTRLGAAFGCSLAMMAAIGACSLEPSPRGTPASTTTAATSTATNGDGCQPSPASDDVRLADVNWYEVDRVGDLQGNSRRTLLIGSLDGRLTHRIDLGSLRAEERKGGTEYFAWVDPQADGVFNGAALVWGRDGRRQSVESVDLGSGSTTTLVEAEGTVQVATADDALSRVFFVTVDEATNRPTGLWTHVVGQAGGPRRVTYAFSQQPVSNRFKYRLAASVDGSYLAVQPDEGPVTIINVADDTSGDVEPGATMLDFAGSHLIAFGRDSTLLAFDAATLNGTQLMSGTDSAQIVPGGDCLLTVMQIEPNDPRAFEVSAVPLEGVPEVVYSQPPGELGALLGRPDRTFLRIEPTTNWVLLGDSFFPFIESAGTLPKDVPETQYPKLLNMATGRTIRLGPFADET